MKQPLCPLALLYAAGLLLGHFVEAPLLGAFVISFALLLTACVAARVRLVILLVAVFLIGWINLSVRTAVLSPYDLRSVIGPQAQLVTIRGFLTDTPTERVFIHDEKQSWRTLAQVDVCQVQRHSRLSPAFGRVLVLTGGTIPTHFFVGQEISITGVILRPPAAVADGLFDYRKYLASKGMWYTLKVESGDDWALCGPALSPPLTSRFCEWGRAALSEGLGREDEALRLQWAMLLGWQTALTSEVAEPFMRSGTMHIFAISGLHIALIAGILIAILRAITLPRIVCGAVALPLIWFYTAATGWQASAIRATVMMTVVISGWMLRRPGTMLNSLSAAALIILIWDPLQLFQASFQLSFFVVLSLATVGPLLHLVKERFFQLDPLLPYHLRPLWQRAGVVAGNHLWGAVATSLAAFLGALPLTAYYFHLFTPGSLLANLVIVPVSGAALASGLGALATASWAPFIASIFNQGGWFFMHAMIWLSQRATEIPGSWAYVRSPGPVQFLCYYVALFALLGAILWDRRWRGAGWLLVALLGVLSAIQWQMWRRSGEIAVMPLTGTHVVVAREARSSDYRLVNCGSRSSFGLLLKPFLVSLGVNRIEHLLLARADMPHDGALSELSAVFPVTKSSIAPQSPGSKPFRDLLADFEAQVPVARDATNGALLGPWQVLHPGVEDRFRRGEDGAVSMLANIGGVTVLVLPDLGPRGQNALFGRMGKIRADIIIAGLPDSGQPLASALIEQLQPKLVIIADCEFPASRRAGPELRSRLGRAGVPVLFTRDVGAVLLRLHNGRWELRTGMRLES